MTEIRAARPGDWAALQALYAAAFPDEALGPLVEALLAGPDAAFSLVAADRDRTLGHVAFSPCGVAEAAVPMSLLGPLAVLPAVQRQGIGGQLVLTGLTHLRGLGVARVFVYGDPDYYRRFGFTPESNVVPPHPPKPERAHGWQSVGLTRAEAVSGTLRVPAAWNTPDLWA